MSALSVSRIGLPLSHDSASAMDSRFSSMRSAILFRMRARSAAGLAPGGSGGVRGVERLVDVGRVGPRHLAEHLAGDRRAVLEVLARGGGHPLAVDVVVVAGLEGHQRAFGARPGINSHGNYLSCNPWDDKCVGRHS